MFNVQLVTWNIVELNFIASVDRPCYFRKQQGYILQVKMKHGGLRILESRIKRTKKRHLLLQCFVTLSELRKPNESKFKDGNKVISLWSSKDE